MIVQLRKEWVLCSLGVEHGVGGEEARTAEFCKEAASAAGQPFRPAKIRSALTTVVLRGALTPRLVFLTH